ncbi:ABC transporter ATP-binding protein [Caldanaerobacter subterraneus]|uniref:ABC transporter ATP-binding protein n=1 Tax=Caldanaerobacter subterraneus TaxID=911092 RepID=A0A7Y2L543_9THEO|nr:ABC transporter ATP-binding protein [Caldanaerobacter subterraneus]NNG65914.1 ABC transporter ATP-binding protein [Caldanaerobacter subterraneus]
MLEVKNLSFSYDDKKVLKNVSFITKGKINCFIGPNGSGKSTLLKVITGILKPEEGMVIWNKMNLEDISIKERSKIFSYVPQEFSITFPYSVFDVVLMGRNPHVDFIKGPSLEDKILTLKYLELLKIDHLRERPFTSLSGGQKRMVLIARGLVQEGEILVLDEPTSSLDFGNQFRILKFIKEIAANLDKTVLMSLHDPNLALYYCDEVFLMKNGGIVCNGSPEEVLTNKELLESIYSLKMNFVNMGSKYKFIFPQEIFCDSSYSVH